MIEVQDSFDFKDVTEEPPQTDKIDKYVKQMAIWKRLEEKQKEEKKYLHKERLRKAMYKKHQLLAIDRIKHQVYLERWFHINKETIRLTKIRNELRKKMSFATAWNKIMFVRYVFLPKLYSRYVNRHDQIQHEIKRDICARRVVSHLKHFIRKFGKTPDNRNGRQLGMGLVLFSQWQSNQNENKAKEIIKVFLQNKAGLNQFNEKVIKCWKFIVIIQDRWRDIVAKRELQKRVVEYMWNNEIEVIEQYCLKNKTNKKIKMFYHKLLTIDEDIKDKILSNYMELRR